MTLRVCRNFDFPGLFFARLVVPFGVESEFEARKGSVEVEATDGNGTAKEDVEVEARADWGSEGRERVLARASPASDQSTAPP